MLEHKLTLRLPELSQLVEAIQVAMQVDEVYSFTESPYVKQIESFVLWGVYVRLVKKMASLQTKMKIECKFTLHQVEINVLSETLLPHMLGESLLYEYFQSKSNC